MLKPMPSPRGTNIEKLYILRGRGSPSNPVAAYDSAYRDGPRTAAEGARYGAALAKKMLGNHLAYDAAPVDPLDGAGAGAGASNADAVGQIVTWATQNLDEREIEELITALGNRNMSLDRRRTAMDARRPARGMSSAASASFHEMFPDAARIRTW